MEILIFTIKPTQLDIRIDNYRLKLCSILLSNIMSGYWKVYKLELNALAHDLSFGEWRIDCDCI